MSVRLPRFDIPKTRRTCLRCRKKFDSDGYRLCESCHTANQKYGRCADHVRSSKGMAVPTASVLALAVTIEGD